tara:strand:+ start:19447 stop:19674 length:228 start_codon:yes stop_codon:yes gene_type:complete
MPEANTPEENVEVQQPTLPIHFVIEVGGDDPGKFIAQSYTIKGGLLVAEVEDSVAIFDISSCVKVVVTPVFEDGQ